MAPSDPPRIIEPGSELPSSPRLAGASSFRNAPSPLSAGVSTLVGSAADGAFAVSEPRAARRLENNANSSSRDQRRAARFGRRSALWRASLLPRLRKCGRTPIGSGVEIRHGEHGAGFGGVVTCGSVWACPCCSGKILAHRQDEIRGAVAAHLADPASGRQLAMATLTIRHRKGDPLVVLWNAVSKAWAAVTSGKVWQRERDAHGLTGWLRVVEVTQGEHGWHVHVHALLFLDRADTSAGQLTPGDLDVWQRAIVGRWARAVERLGLHAPLPRAQDLHLIQGDADPLAGYFTKAADNGIAQAVALEFTRSAGKTGRTIGSRSPWGILDGVMERDLDDLRLWHEYEKGSRGRRQITWSRGLRDALGLAPEQADDEVAEGQDRTPLCQIDGDSWRRTTWSTPALLPVMLDTAEALVERHGAAVGAFELVRWLGTMGVVAWLPYQTRDPDPPPQPQRSP